jgi:hypothetical protein
MNVTGRATRDPSGGLTNRLVITLVLVAATALGVGAAGVPAAGVVAARRSATLSPVIRRSRCHVHDALPDHGCTPGGRFIDATRMLVCTPGYSRRVRQVPYAEKTAVYAEYAISRHFNGRNGEVDHLVALELGGSNDESNLWPESAAGRYGAHQKDRLENELHHEICRGSSLKIERAQRLLAGDWVSVYRARFS